MLHLLFIFGVTEDGFASLNVKQFVFYLTDSLLHLIDKFFVF